jgi:hypothetical protein
MQIDRFTKSCLITIVLLLAVLVLRPNVKELVVQASGPTEYKVILIQSRGNLNAEQNNIETELNAEAKQGWILVQKDPYFLIFRK